MGNSSYWMALAAKHNGVGHVWSVDDFSMFKIHEDVLTKTIGNLRKAQFASIEPSTPQQYFEQIRKLMDLDEILTFTAIVICRGPCCVPEK